MPQAGDVPEEELAGFLFAPRLEDRRRVHASFRIEDAPATATLGQAEGIGRAAAITDRIKRRIAALYVRGDEKCSHRGKWKPYQLKDGDRRGPRPAMLRLERDDPEQHRRHWDDGRHSEVEHRLLTNPALRSARSPRPRSPLRPRSRPNPGRMTPGARAKDGGGAPCRRFANLTRDHGEFTRATRPKSASVDILVAAHGWRKLDPCAASGERNPEGAASQRL